MKKKMKIKRGETASFFFFSLSRYVNFNKLNVGSSDRLPMNSMNNPKSTTGRP